MNEQQVRIGCNEGDWREVFHRIVAELALKRCDRVGVRNHHERVSVGRRFRDQLGRDRSISSGPVVHDERMGTKGMGSLAGVVMGSVATKVIQLSPVPVLVMKKRSPAAR